MTGLFCYRWTLSCPSTTLRASLDIRTSGSSLGCVTSTSSLGNTLSNGLGTGHADARRSFPALALHHATQDANEFGGILEFGVIHCLLCAINILDCAPSDSTRAIVIVHTVPQECAVLKSHRQSQGVGTVKELCSI